MRVGLGINVSTRLHITPIYRLHGRLIDVPVCAENIFNKEIVMLDEDTTTIDTLVRTILAGTAISISYTKINRMYKSLMCAQLPPDRTKGDVDEHLTTFKNLSRIRLMFVRRHNAGTKYKINTVIFVELEEPLCQKY